MNSELALEIKRLKKFFAELGLPFEPDRGAKPGEFLEVESELEISFD